MCVTLSFSFSVIFEFCHCTLKSQIYAKPRLDTASCSVTAYEETCLCNKERLFQYTHINTQGVVVDSMEVNTNFFFANLKANYCIFDECLIGLLAMNLNMNKKGNRCIFWSNCDKTGTRQCMDRNCDRLYFMNINYCRVIQMLFNLLSKLMLINIHKTSKAETGKFQFQPKAVLIWALCLPFFSRMFDYFEI